MGGFQTAVGVPKDGMNIGKPYRAFNMHRDTGGKILAYPLLLRRPTDGR